MAETLTAARMTATGSDEQLLHAVRPFTLASGITCPVSFTLTESGSAEPATHSASRGPVLRVDRPSAIDPVIRPVWVTDLLPAIHAASNGTY